MELDLKQLEQNQPPLRSTTQSTKPLTVKRRFYAEYKYVY